MIQAEKIAVKFEVDESGLNTQFHFELNKILGIGKVFLDKNALISKENLSKEISHFLGKHFSNRFGKFFKNSEGKMCEAICLWGGCEEVSNYPTSINHLKLLMQDEILRQLMQYQKTKTEWKIAEYKKVKEVSLTSIKSEILKYIKENISPLNFKYDISEIVNNTIEVFLKRKQKNSTFIDLFGDEKEFVSKEGDVHNLKSLSREIRDILVLDQGILNLAKKQSGTKTQRLLAQMKNQKDVLSKKISVIQQAQSRFGIRDDGSVWSPTELAMTEGPALRSHHKAAAAATLAVAGLGISGVDLTNDKNPASFIKNLTEINMFSDAYVEPINNNWYADRKILQNSPEPVLQNKSPLIKSSSFNVPTMTLEVLRKVEPLSEYVELENFTGLKNVNREASSDAVNKVEQMTDFVLSENTEAYQALMSRNFSFEKGVERALVYFFLEYCKVTELANYQNFSENDKQKLLKIARNFAANIYTKNPEILKKLNMSGSEILSLAEKEIEIQNKPTSALKLSTAKVKSL